MSMFKAYHFRFLSNFCMWLARLALIALVFTPVISHADLRTPAWYNNNVGGPASDWHYRVPVVIPAGTAVNATIKVDVDFAALILQLGLSDTFDANSPRVVSSTNVLATTQEFTPTIYAGATNATAGRGEIRFILQDAGPVTYYIYFDIVSNNAKTANPQTPINGNFEASPIGAVPSSTAVTPIGWTSLTKTLIKADAVVRGPETVLVTAYPTSSVVDGVNTRSTDGNPKTGQRSMLMGWRTSTSGQSAGAPLVTLTRTFTVPATNSGVFTFRWRPEGWDATNETTGFDYIKVTLTAGATTQVLTGPSSLNSYAVAPAAPNYQGNGSSAATATLPGYGQYNGFDCDTAGGHHQGMTTVTCHGEPWFTLSQSLSAFAGQTVTASFVVNQDNNDISWYHLDDVEWSVTTASLGTPEGFGVNLTSPTALTVYTVGQSVNIIAQIDAKVNKILFDIYNNNSVPATVKTGGNLYNNALNGDVTAADNFWANNGLSLATFTLSGAYPPGTNWLVRIFAQDGSTSTVSTTPYADMVHIPGQPTPQVQANYYNIDEQTFIYNAAQLTLVKSLLVLNDPSSGTTNPKAIPGAEVRYSITASNTGKDVADSNSTVIIDPVPANTTMFVGDFNGAGSGPIAFVNNTPTSGLTYTYTNLASTTDNIDFSKDSGATWTYVPVPDANGYDTKVTTVRIRPQGAFAAFASNPAPSCTVMFKVRIN